mgnify:FL=1
MKKNTKQTKDDKMKKPKQHPKQKGFRMGLRAKILGISLPITIIMVIAMIAIAYSVSEKDIMKSSQSLLRTSAKDQGNQIEAWLNRKLDEVKTVKYDLEHSGAVKDQKLLQKKLNDYYALDDSFVGGFYVTDTAGTVMKADDNTTQINNAKDQIWYQKGLTRMNPGYTPVFEDAENHMMISACGMLDDATNIRILSTNLSLDSVNIIVNSSVSMQGAESLLVDKSTGDILASRESELIATSIKDTSNGFLKNVADKINKDDESVTTIRDKVVVTREIAGTDWVLVSYVPTSLITSEVDNLRTILIGVAIIGLLVFTLLNTIGVSLTVKPLRILSHKIKAMSNGDFTIQIEVKGTDEIAQIQQSVKIFTEYMREMICKINAVSDSIRNQADSSSVVSVSMQDASNAQAASMAALSETVEQISESINEIAESATDLSGVVSDVSRDSEQVKLQIDSTVGIARKGRSDMELVGTAMDEIRDSMSLLVDAIRKVGEASKEITGITSLIANISEETSLLSLNASIEAARAGEAGKGFSVVATEISKLAQNTASSVEEISQLISQVDGLVDDAVNQANVSVQNIGESGGRIRVAQETFEQIYTCIEDMKNGINNMITQIAAVNNVAMDVSAISEEQAASTTVISETSDAMVDQANNLAGQSEQVADSSKVLTNTSEQLAEQMGRFQI